jgi:hypothetical protein
MTVAILMGNCKGSCIYPTREDLVYWRAMYNGMAPEDSVARRTILASTSERYLGFKHLKGVSSKRSELACMRGMRLVFETCTKFKWKGAKTKEQLEEKKVLKEKLMSKCKILKAGWFVIKAKRDHLTGCLGWVPSA